MEPNRRLKTANNSFGKNVSWRSESAFSAAPKENAIDMLARELGGMSSAEEGFPVSDPPAGPASPSAISQPLPKLQPPATASGLSPSGGHPLPPFGRGPAGLQGAPSSKSGGSDVGRIPLEQKSTFSPLKASRLASQAIDGSSTSQAGAGLGWWPQDVTQVDGVSFDELKAWFAEADSGSKGFITPAEAVVFFKRTGLPKESLSKMWNRAKAGSSGAGGRDGLDLGQFSRAMRLVALAQDPRQAGEEEAWRVVLDTQQWRTSGRAPLAPPRVAPLPGAVSNAPGPAPLPVAGRETAALSAYPAPGVVGLADLQGRSGQEAIARTAGPCQPMDLPAFPLDGDREATGESPSRPGGGGRMPEVPVSFDARLPPLHPKKCSRLSMMAAAHGSLFAGPSTLGGVLQWGRPEGNMRRPTLTQNEDIVVSERTFAARNEDPDIAPSSETPIPDAKQVSCMHTDEVNNILWMGHMDGKVSGFLLGPAPGSPINTRRIHHWQAHKVGRVTAICTTAWGDVWTGSSRGTIRVWRVESQPGGVGSVSIARELRRQGGFRASAHAINFLVVPSCGQVVWSTGAKSLILWDAYTGAYLGSVSRSSEADLEREGRFRIENSERDERYVPRLQIDHRRGLDLDEWGRVATTTFSSRRCDYIADQEQWAMHTDKKASEWVENMGVLGGKAMDNAGKAAGKAKKYVSKLVRNMKKGEGGGGSSGDMGNLPLGARYRASMDTPGVSLAEPQELSGEEQMEDALEKVGKEGHLCAMVADSANCIWAAWQNGVMERFTFNGKLLTKKDLGTGISSLAVVGPRLWVGLSDGRIRVLAERSREWRAHKAGVLAFAVCGSRVYSLAADGSIKGWCSTVPSDYDQVARQALDAAGSSLVEQQKMDVLCMTWNVNQQKPDARSAFFGIVNRLSRAEDIKVAVFGLQEIEMGSGSVAMAAAKDKMNKKAQEKGNNNGKWWAGQLLIALGGYGNWRQCGLRQLSGMLIVVFARTELEGKIGEISTASVACGVLGVGGNKGAVAVSFTLCRRRIACVCSHFAAHQEGLEARYQNYASITRNLTFSTLPWYDMQVYSDEDDHLFRMAHRVPVDNDSDSEPSESEAIPETISQIDLVQGQGMRAAEMLIWLGDFNYRVNCSYEEAKEYVKEGWIKELLAKDQCRLEMKAGRVFRHMREGQIRFPPTYKFNKFTPDPLGYDTSEKRRVPSWTDRVFFRGSFRRDLPEEETAGSQSEYNCQDDQLQVGKAEAISVEALEYDSCMGIIESDHKPVWSRLAVTLPVTLQERRRRKCSHLLKDCFLHSMPEPPQIRLSTNVVTLHPIEERADCLRVENVGTSPAVIRITPAVLPWEHTPPDAPRELPEWLDVFPLSARIAPQAILEVSVSLAVRESTWAPRDKRCLLKMRVDHDFAAGGERPEGEQLRDKTFTVACSSKFTQ